MVHVEVQKFCPMAGGTDEAVLQHLGISGKKVLSIECLEELSFYQYIFGWREYSDFILQPIEVDACLSADRCIDHRQ